MRRIKNNSKFSLESLIGSFATMLIGYLFLTEFLKHQVGKNVATVSPSVIQSLNIPAWVWAIFIELIVVAIVYRIYQYYRLSKAGIYEIDRMSGTQFEEKLVILFSQLGYSAHHIGKVGDYGVDLIIEKDGVKTAVQAKRYGYKEHVPESAIQQAYTGCKYYNCSESLVVTNSFFTNAAYHLARSINVSLWNRNDLINALLEARSKKYSTPNINTK